MLILKRKLNEVIHIGDNITVIVTEIGPAYVKLGIDAPRDTEVHREEVYVRIHTETT